MAIDYKKAGVDMEAGDNLVSWLQETAPKSFPHSDKIVSGIGGFASLFKIPIKGMKSPCLVSGTDGVGTKLKVAFHFQKYDTIGQDLVAMCVNDILTCGAEPLFFLDYYATGKLDLEQAKSFLKGLRAACIESGCALTGGETAEMPGFYDKGEFDCAGFAVGLVDQEETLGAHRVREGDLVLGFSSSGFHSNGYSLLRKVFEKDMDDWKDILLKPTALYTNLAKELKVSGGVHAFAHITGGGMENIPRVIPEGYGFVLQRWEWPLPFKEVQSRSEMTNLQMLETLNCGIGWVAIVSPKVLDKSKEIAAQLNYKIYELGTIQKDLPSIDYKLWRDPS